MSRRRRWLAPVAALFVLAADAPAGSPGLPSLDQLANASPAVLLAFGFAAFLRGWIVQGYLYDRAEKRANDATAAAALSNTTAANAIAAVSKLSDDHMAAIAKLTEDHRLAIAELRRDLAKWRPPVKGPAKGAT